MENVLRSRGFVEEVGALGGVGVDGMMASQHVSSGAGDAWEERKAVKVRGKPVPKLVLVLLNS